MPTINTISDEIDKQRLTGKDMSGQRWELLYELGEKKKVELEEKRKHMKEEEEKKEKEEYSFHPKTCQYQKVDNEKTKSKVQERTEAWAKNKESKIKARKEELEKQKLESCTFKPVLVTTSSAVSREKTEDEIEAGSNTVSLKSVDKYIERRKALREQKEEYKKKAENSVGSGRI